MTVDWQPANEVEVAMAQAMLSRDRAAFFRAVTTAELYLPQVETDPAGAQTFLVTELAGRTVLPVFTSVEGLAGFAGAYTVTGYPELREKWPRPQWWLAVNPGLPIDAYLPVEAVAVAAEGELDVPTVGEVILDAMAADPAGVSALLDTDEALRGAGGRGDGPEFIEALLAATVIVPTTGEVSDPEEILAEERPWRVTGPPDAPVVEVFTSAQTLARAYPRPGPHLVVPLMLLLTVWPERHALSVNPGTPLAVTLSSAQVSALAVWSVPEEPEPAPESGAAS